MIERDDKLAKAMVDRVLGGNLIGPFAGFVESEGGFPVSAAVLNMFTEHDLHLTVVARRVSNSFARFIARECFDFCKVSRVTAITRETNRQAIRCLARFGFVLEGRLDGYYGDEAANIYGLHASRQRLTG